MDADRTVAAYARERRSVAALLERLDQPQPATPSVCAGWDVFPPWSARGPLTDALVHGGDMRVPLGCRTSPTPTPSARPSPS
jgi:hypothetical protein